jgi:hypothetical protein
MLLDLTITDALANRIALIIGNFTSNIFGLRNE